MDTSALKIYEPLGGVRPNAWKPQRFKYWYDHIIDLLLTDPTLTQKDIAAQLGKSPSTIGMVMATDLFKMRYELRKQEQSGALQAKINGRLADVTIAALENLKLAIDKKRDSVPVQELADVADKALARLGYGPKQPPAQPAGGAVNVNVFAPITPEQLAAARTKIIEHQAKEVVVADLPPSGGGRSEGGDSV